MRVGRGLKRRMTERNDNRDGLRRTAAVSVRLACLAALGLALAGCASGGEALTSVYVDPARYALYDCVQLRTAMRTHAKRAAELQGLMNKAQGGFAGGVVSEVAYRNDYISARANYKLADDEWRRNKCDSQKLPPDRSEAKPLRNFDQPEENEQLKQADQVYRRAPER